MKFITSDADVHNESATALDSGAEGAIPELWENQPTTARKRMYADAGESG